MRKLLRLFDTLSPEAAGLQTDTLRLCCVMLVCSLALLLRSGGLQLDTYELYRTAAALQSESAAVLLGGSFAALLLEQLHRR